MGAFSVETKVGKLLENEAAKSILEKYLPGISTSQQTKMVINMSLKQMCSFPQAGVDKAKLQQMGEELAAIE